MPATGNSVLALLQRPRRARRSRRPAAVENMTTPSPRPQTVRLATKTLRMNRSYDSPEGRRFERERCLTGGCPNLETHFGGAPPHSGQRPAAHDVLNVGQGQGGQAAISS